MGNIKVGPNVPGPSGRPTTSSPGAGAGDARAPFPTNATPGQSRAPGTAPGPAPRPGNGNPGSIGQSPQSARRESGFQGPQGHGGGHHVHDAGATPYNVQTPPNPATGGQGKGGGLFPGATADAGAPPPQVPTPAGGDPRGAPAPDNAQPGQGGMPGATHDASAPPPSNGGFVPPGQQGGGATHDASAPPPANGGFVPPGQQGGPVHEAGAPPPAPGNSTPGQSQGGAPQGMPRDPGAHDWTSGTPAQPQTAHAPQGQPAPQPSTGAPPPPVPAQGGNTSFNQGGSSPEPTNLRGQPQAQPAQTNIGTPLSELPLANANVRDGFREPFRARTDVPIQGRPAEAPVASLAPPLDDAKTLADVHGRFARDYPLLKGQVVDLPHLTTPEKAERALEFFAGYAARFVALAHGEEKALKDAAPEEPHADSSGAPPEPKAPRDAATARPVLGASEADAHLDQEAATDPDMDALPHPPQHEAKPAEKKSRLDRLLAGELPEAPGKEQSAKEQKVRQGRLGGELPQAPEEPDARQAKARHQAAALPGHAEVLEQAESFTKLLGSFDFQHLRDEASGKDGVQLAREMLNARSQEEVHRLAEQHQLTADVWPPHPPEPEAALPPEAYHPAALAKDAQRLRELGDSSAPQRDSTDPSHLAVAQERSRATPFADAARMHLVPGERDRSANNFAEKLAPELGKLGRKLGSNHLWNALHTFRTVGPDSAVEKEKFDQLAFGAILLLVLLCGGVAMVALL